MRESYISFSVLGIITFEFLLNVIPILSFLRKRNYWYFDFSVLSFLQIGCLSFEDKILTLGILSFWFSHI